MYIILWRPLATFGTSYFHIEVSKWHSCQSHLCVLSAITENVIIKNLYFSREILRIRRNIGRRYVKWERELLWFIHLFPSLFLWDLVRLTTETIRTISATISTFFEINCKLFILSLLSDLTSCLRPKEEEFFPSSGINSINTADYMVKSDILTQILFLQMFFFIKSCLPLTFHICLHHIVWDIWSNILGHYLVIDII